MGDADQVEGTDTENPESVPSQRMPSGGVNFIDGAKEATQASDEPDSEILGQLPAATADCEPPQPQDAPLSHGLFATVDAEAHSGWTVPPEAVLAPTSGGTTEVAMVAQIRNETQDESRNETPTSAPGIALQPTSDGNEPHLDRPLVETAATEASLLLAEAAATEASLLSSDVGETQQRDTSVDAPDVSKLQSPIGSANNPEIPDGSSPVEFSTGATRDAHSFATDLLSTSVESSDVEVPPKGRALRSRPPPKPTQYVSEHPPQRATLGQEAPTLEKGTSEVPASLVAASTVTSIPPVVALEPRRARALPRSVRAILPMVFWAASLVVVFLIGLSFGGPSKTNSTKSDGQLKTAVAEARAQALAEGKAAQEPLAPAFDFVPPQGARPISEVEKVEAGARSRLDAVALGRHWSKQRFDALTQLLKDVQTAPQRLTEEKVRNEIFKYTSDRTTSRVVLETLAEIATAPALDILYEAWTGSKERNETTQLAEALLLAKDVRGHASSALELALALRERPTQCEAIGKLVELAIREGDRRSAMQLVNTGARVNCGASGDQECIKCLAEPKDLRKAVHAAVARPAPF